MAMARFILSGLVALVLLAPAGSNACSLCQKDLLNSLTFRQEAALKEAKIILLGSVEKSDLASGPSKIRILSVVRSDPFLKDDKSIELPKYIPVADPKDPPKFLIYCDVFQNKLDPYRGINVTSEETAKYLKGALALDQKETAKNLLYYFDYLEHRDPHIAKD